MYQVKKSADPKNNYGKSQQHDPLSSLTDCERAVYVYIMRNSDNPDGTNLEDIARTRDKDNIDDIECVTCHPYKTYIRALTLW